MSRQSWIYRRGPIMRMNAGKVGEQDRIDERLGTGPRLHTYQGQHVKARPYTRGYDRIAEIPNLKVSVVELDLYSEVDPLEENIPPLRGAGKLMYLSAHRKVEFLPEISPTLPPLLYMEALQSRIDRRTVSRYERQTDRARLKEDIQAYAASLGFISGVTLLDRRFVTSGHDSDFPYDTVLMLGMEMRKEYLLNAPNFRLRRYPDYDVYRRAGYRVHRVASFLRRQGVSCAARIPFDGAVIYPVHAILAGLGELGAFGGVITPQYGPRQRWCLVSIDADLPLDNPVDFGISRFCEGCLLCIAKCPGKAIPAEPLWWRGVYKRKINDLKCWAFFSNFKGCAICINSCPFHRFGYDAVMDHHARTGEVLGEKEILAEETRLPVKGDRDESIFR